MYAIRSYYDTYVQLCHAAGRDLPGGSEAAARELLLSTEPSRSIGDSAYEKKFTFEATEQMSGKKVAIIGGGPAGMAAAYQLRRMGHASVIFDDHAELGGMMRYGIPGFRTVITSYSIHYTKLNDNEAQVQDYFKAHGMNDLVNDVISKCPTKAISLVADGAVQANDTVSTSYNFV